MEKTMNYSKQILKVLMLVFLLVPAGMKAMEKPSFIDCNGKEVTLNRAQQEAFAQFSVGAMPGVVDFQNTQPFLTVHNILALMRIITDGPMLGLDVDAMTNGVSNEEELVELFKVANYVQAPQKVIAALAERIVQPMEKRIATLENELNARKPSMWNFWNAESEQVKRLQEELDAHKALYSAVHSNLACNDVERLVKKRRGVLKQHVLKPNLNIYEEKNGAFAKTNKPTLDLSYKTLEQELKGTLEPAHKIKSLQGLQEILALDPNLKDIEVIDLSGHELKDFSIEELKQIFPDLKRVNLSNNHINLVDNKNIDASVQEIDLSNNPIKLLCIQDPSQFNATKIIVSGNRFNDSVFKQDKLDKIKAWLKVLGTKGKIAVKSFMDPFRVAEIGIGMGIFAYAERHWKLIKKINEACRKDMIVGSLLQNKTLEEARNIAEQRLRVIHTYNNRLAVLSRCVVIGGLLYIWWDHRHDIQQDFQWELQQAIQNNPYAVALENDEAGYEFPSDEKRAL